MVSATKSYPHIAWIDFLRGISAFAVVLFHVRVDLWVGWNEISSHPQNYGLVERIVSLLSLPLPFFGYAVMMFFLVSGFCIHYPYANSERELKLKSYFIRRFFRIYPPYIAVIFLGLLSEQLTHFLGQSSSSIKTVVQSIFMTQNYGSGQMVSNPSLWSLPVEVELYLVYPFFYWILLRWGIRRAMMFVLVTSLLASGSLLFLGNSLISGSFLKYWIIWCAGALLAEWKKQDQVPPWYSHHTIVVLSIIVVAVAAYLLSVPVDLQNFIWAGAYFMIMLWGLSKPDPLLKLGGLLRNICLFLGLISYSLYLVHFPFFRLGGAAWLAVFGSKPGNLLIAFIACLLCIPISYAFYNFFEAPSHRLARQLAKSKKFT